MSVPVLYLVVVLIWGTTWTAIPLQLGPVPEELSVGYRFAIASLSLLAYAGLNKRRLTIPWKQYPMIVLMGALLFSINYLFVYYGAGYVTSGLIAVLFSLIIVFNALFARLFFGTAFERRMKIAAAVGIIGIALVFWPEISDFGFADKTTIGIAWVLLAVVVAAIANMAAIVNMGRGLSVMVVNAHAMGWGAVTSFSIALLLDRPIIFLFTPEYMWSLFYLAIFGSSIAFGCYLALLKKIGATRAAYSSVLFPLVALLMSTIFEGYRWTPITVIGVGLTLAGNWLALTKTTTSSNSTHKGK